MRELTAGNGFTPVDAGGLKNARYLEPVAGLNIYFVYGAGHSTQIAPNWIRRDCASRQLFASGKAAMRGLSGAPAVAGFSALPRAEPKQSDH